MEYVHIDISNIPFLSLQNTENTKGTYVLQHIKWWGNAWMQTKLKGEQKNS